MPSLVPESARASVEEGLAQELGESLAAVLEFTGASAGWIGLQQEDGCLAFPVRQGAIAQAWLTLQQGRAGPWGFGVGEESTLLNNLSHLRGLGEPALNNLLSCPLMRNGAKCGQIAAANKPNGFNSHDASVFQALAHWISRRLERANPPPVEQLDISAALPCDLLNRLDEGVFVGDETGRLVWANTTWLGWTGFSLAQLVGQVAPFPFWISHQDLVLLRLEKSAPADSTGEEAIPTSRPLPFRRNDKTVFWCSLETIIEDLAGGRFVLALLRKAPDAAAPPPSSAAAKAAPGQPHNLPLPADLPFAAARTDATGRIIWANELFFQQIAPAPVALGARMQERLVGIPANLLQRVAAETRAERRGQVGRLIFHTVEGGISRPLIVHWSTLTLLDGVDFLFAFSDDWSELGLYDDWPGARGTEFQQPGADCLALLLTPGREVALWDPRWSARTGLADRELAGVPSEVALDWLFPTQRDRNRVADLMLHPERRTGQLVLDLLIPGGSQPFVCTFLAVSQPGGHRWLLLADDLCSPAWEGSAPFASTRSFLRGLASVLNHKVLAPQSLVESALKRGNLSPEVTTALTQILDRGQGVGRLLAALQDLAAARLPSAEKISLPILIREFLTDEKSSADDEAFDLDVDLPEVGFEVRVNQQMIKTVLRHLYLNARQALPPDRRRRIQVRVFARADFVGCSITDNGEGLQVEDWAQLLAPFVSTKGPYAHDAHHAAFDAAGLGLTVCRHLLALHGGRLELRAQPDAGTSAVFFLPRAELSDPRSP
jgi:signal transduction histidine kinase